MKTDKVIKILLENNFWIYTDRTDDIWDELYIKSKKRVLKHFSNGKVQITILNNKVYKWEHYTYKRGCTKNDKINNFKELNNFINLKFEN